MSQFSHFPLFKKQVGNLKYAYVHQGNGEPVFFLHGFPDHAGAWDKMIDVLSANFTCIAPFLRGYYPSDIPQNQDYAMASIAEDIHLLAKELGYNEYSVVGQDWGATVAYVMANRYPQEVRRVVALNMPHPQFLKPSIKLLYKARHILYFNNKQKAAQRLVKSDFQYLDTLYKRWSPNFDFGNLKEQMVSCFKRDGRTEAALGYYWQLGKETNEIAELYKQLPTMPTLTLVGEKDGTVDLNQFKKMELEDCFTVKYHQLAGHFLHREYPDFCINQIKHFLRGDTNKEVQECNLERLK